MGGSFLNACSRAASLVRGNRQGWAIRSQSTLGYPPLRYNPELQRLYKARGVRSRRILVPHQGCLVEVTQHVKG
eukprot:scaffold123542_cov19-Tisochrysis_lutea.AAC.2